MHDVAKQAPGNDFFSGFGQGGSGAPIRDKFGNVVTTRTRGPAVASKPVDIDQVKNKAQNDYQRDLK